MYAIRLAASHQGKLYPQVVGDTGPFEGQLWVAECFCDRRYRHRIVPAKRGNCGLYAVIRAKINYFGGLVMVWQRQDGGSVAPVTAASLKSSAVVLVEALGLTIRHRNGVVRSAKQIPRLILGAKELEKTYECEVTQDPSVFSQIARLKVPGVVWEIEDWEQNVVGP